MFIGSMPVCDFAQLKQAPSSVDCWVAFWFFAGKTKTPRLDDSEEGVEAAGAAAAGAGCWAYPAVPRSAPSSSAEAACRRCSV